MFENRKIIFKVKLNKNKKLNQKIKYFKNFFIKYTSNKKNNLKKYH